MKTIKRTIHQPTTTISNFITVKDDDIGDILFGCPPEVVKYFNSKNIPIPSYIVIPQRIFRKGKNYFDLEFVVNTILFPKQNKKSITVACTESQEESVRTLLQVSLFGPYLKDLFSSLLFESLTRLRLGKLQKNSLKRITEQIGENSELYSHFKEIMSLRPAKEIVLSKMRPVLRQLLGNISWIERGSQKRIYGLIAGAYVEAAMMKHEMDVFSVCEKEKRDEFINRFISFKIFDSKGNVTLTNREGSKLKICQTKFGTFKLYKKGRLIDSFDLQLVNRNERFLQIAPSPLEIPEFGVTFLGSGTGFDPDTCTNCFIIWINGKGIAVDLLVNCEDRFRQLGIASSDVTHIFLSHLHSDHDAGVIEKILIGEKSHLLTSNIIFDSFLKKAEAVTKFTKSSIRDFVYFTALKAGKEIRVPGIDRTYITFDYSLHSIPTGRFKLRYKSLSGKEIKIGFSSDTKFDKKLVNKLYKNGTITAGRRDDILGFLWDCDLIIHEAGGGTLHTEAKDLMVLPAQVRKKCILTHTDKKMRNFKGFRYAKEGETISLIKQKYPHAISDFMPLIKNTGIFPRFTSKQFDNLIRNSSIETFSKNQYVFKQESIGRKLYIILSGFAEVIKNGKALSIYEKGSFFGELALINRDCKRMTSIRAKSKLQLLGIDKFFYEKYHLSTIIKERIYELTNYFADSTNSSLIGYISRGEFLIFMKGEDIITFGDTSRDVYILISGEVDILDSEERLIAHVTDVEVLGEMAFLKDIPRTATVKVTSKQATAIHLDFKLFAEISDKFPSFYATALKKMERRWDAVWGGVDMKVNSG
ncbi:MAG: cyclic nucleotide-binding domain-containing protein [Candidatus Scalindua sp.]